MVMPAQPVTSLEVIEPEFIFQLTVIHFDPPTRMSYLHQTTQTGAAGSQLCQPIPRWFLSLANC
jgi:hypothetical protein